MGDLVDKLKIKFLVKNLLRGIITLALIVLGIILLNNKLEEGGLDWATELHPLLVYFVFLFSEVVFGVIPPEFFIVWSVESGLFNSFPIDILFLSIISFGAGILGYNIGALVSYAPWFTRFKNKFLLKYEAQLMQYGGFLIFVGALTPLPYSAICMVVGAYKYPFKKFLFYASFRFVRYALYSYIIWHAMKV